MESARLVSSYPLQQMIKLYYWGWKFKNISYNMYRVKHLKIHENRMHNRYLILAPIHRNHF